MIQALLCFEGDAFAGDEDGRWWGDAGLFGVVALVNGDADATAGVHVEQSFADGDFHEGLGVRKSDGLLVEEQRDFVAEAVGELLEFVAGNVGDERAEGVVEGDDVTGDALIGDDSGFRTQADELGKYRPYESEIASGGEMRGDGRENVAAVKRGRDGRLDHPVGVGDFAGRFEAVAVDDRSDKAVVRKNEVLAFFGFDDDGFARGADARVHDDKKDGARGIVRGNALEEARAFLDGVGGDLMGDVHDAGVGGDADDHRFADGYRVVGDAKVAHKDDGRMGRRRS